MGELNIAVAVPTCNAARHWEAFHDALMSQSLRPTQILMVDSSSTDGTQQLAGNAGFKVHTIARTDFDHGGTRQLAVDLLSDSQIIVFLTQDAILSDKSAIANLVSAFEDPSVGAAYGRQLPRPGATPIEAHARHFNYPDQSVVRDLESRKFLGFKSIFLSDSFSAYRREALMPVGGFPTRSIFGEDTIVTAKLHLAGWKTAYVADAEVFHSHSYSPIEELRRYFDIGVLHARESWLRAEFGNASGEGRRFVLSELKFLWPGSAHLIPSALLRTFVKLVGYHLGIRERLLPLSLKKALTMNRMFWSRANQNHNRVGSAYVVDNSHINTGGL